MPVIIMRKKTRNLLRAANARRTKRKPTVARSVFHVKPKAKRKPKMSKKPHDYVADDDETEPVASAPAEPEFDPTTALVELVEQMALSAQHGAPVTPGMVETLKKIHDAL